MAERRMFHGAVVESDAFLDLPLGAQVLYFHLGMKADDDGFVNGPRQIVRSVGAAPEDLELLVERGFLLWFDGVAVIKHWRMANSLQNDRIKPLRYPEIAKEIYLKENKTYTLQQGKRSENLLVLRRKSMDSSWNPNGIQLESKRNPNGIPKERKRKEKKGTEKKGTERKVAEVEKKPDSAAAATAQEQSLSFFRGKLGKGVVLLSQEQVEDLLEKLGMDGFDYYVEKLADFILKSDAKVKNHYATICKWWQEDRGV